MGFFWKSKVSQAVFKHLNNCHPQTYMIAMDFTSHRRNTITVQVYFPWELSFEINCSSSPEQLGEMETLERESASLVSKAVNTFHCL